MNEIKSVNNEKILRVGIYERLSDEDRNKQNKSDDSESIKNQRKILEMQKDMPSGIIVPPAGGKITRRRVWRSTGFRKNKGKSGNPFQTVAKFLEIG